MSEVRRTWTRLVRALALVVVAGLGVGAASAWATFPGRNGKIVYAWLGVSAYRAGPTETSIRTVDPRSGRVRVVRDCPLRNDEWRSLFTDCSVWAPRSSPDGRTIAFPAIATAADLTLQPPWRSHPLLDTIAPDGSELEEHTTVTRYGALAWSPAGDRFLVQRALGPAGAYPDPYPSAIFLASLDGTELGQVAPDRSSMPDWSSTGRIAFSRGAYASSCYPNCFEIYLTRLGGGPRRLTFHGGENPSWSPHGSKLAFVRTQHVRRDVYTREIYIVGRDGRHRRHLTRGDNPVWSPNGRSVAFLRYGDIYVTRSSGGRIHRVLDAPSGPHSLDDPTVMSLDWQAKP